MITCQVNRVLFDNLDTGFHIVKAELIDGKDELPKFVTPSNGCIVIKGYFPTSKVVMLEVDGNWENSKYGYQLSVTSFTEIIPKTKEGIIAYLSSFVYGMKDTTAKKIVDQFGLDTIQVFEETPEKLLEVRGIGRKKLKKIVESFSASRSIQDIVSYLAPYGITPNKCVKIANEFGSEAMSVLTNEPFRLCEIDGFGFKTVDEIARKTTFELKDPLRIKGAIKFVIQNAANEGHLCLKQQEAIISAYLLLNQIDYTQNKVKKSIDAFLKDHNFSSVFRQVVVEDVPLECVVTEFKNMAVEGTIKGDNNYVYLSSEYNQENDVADIMVTRLRRTDTKIADNDISKEIAVQEKAMNIQLASKQKEAVALGVKSNTCIITGGPGTGKTTVLKVVLKVCQKFLHLEPSDITLLAPTGRAAQRMCESVGADYSASTIHSCLKISNEEGKGAYDTITSKVVVVDEASMVDNYIAWCLLKAVPITAKLIIIGDAEQLPSVGAGNVLFELLHCKKIPTVKLDVIYRQEGTNPIVVNSGLIQKGITNLRYDSNFKFINVKETSDYPKNDRDKGKKIQQETADIVIEQFIRAIDEYGLDEVQVLCPFRKKGVIAGATELNKAIQDKVNPASKQKSQIKRGDTIFREGDKVIQTKNDNDLGFYNGDVGYITKIDSDEDIHINFGGKEAIYDITQMANVELAYAISIHKSQGSEYKTVIIPIITAFSIMLKRNLIYTGITRAKKRVILVGHQKALSQAIKTNVIAKRNTQLGNRIISKMNTERLESSEQLKLF